MSLMDGGTNSLNVSGAANPQDPDCECVNVSNWISETLPFCGSHESLEEAKKYPGCETLYEQYKAYELIKANDNIH